MEGTSLSCILFIFMHIYISLHVLRDLLQVVDEVLLVFVDLASFFGDDAGIDVERLIERDGDEVLVGDWDGDGIDTFAVRRGNTFFIKNAINAGAADETIVYGRVGDEVLVGDWDADGIDTFIVRRGNTFFVKNTIGAGPADEVRVLGSGDELAYAAYID